MLRAILKELQLLREIGQRLTKPKPLFWKRVQARAAATAAGITGLIAAEQVPASLLPYFKGAALGFGVLAIAAQLPCVDAPADSPPSDTI
jgi:hypothetical protein